MKDSPKEEIIETAKSLKTICAEAEAILIIDDHVDIAKDLELDGVHLGKNDMPVKEARELLGEKFIIGATANTVDDVVSYSPIDIDYIGLGPFKYTTTKANLSPIISTDSYANIVKVAATSKKEIPIVAIGGITFNDIDTIMETGVDGIAVSGALINAPNTTEATKQMINKLNEILHKRLSERGLI
jgi:thiamine-phosphate pyrophosphorylase